MIKHILVFAALVALLLAGCAPETTIDGTITPAPQDTPPADAPPPQSRNLRVMTHDSFSISEEVLAAFEAENNVTVQFLLSGDTGSALNRAILSRDNPLADVFFGVDNTFLSRALEENIFEAYSSPLLDQIPDEFQLDPQNRALPVDYGDVCLNYDRLYFEEASLQPPQNLEDLLDPEYRRLLVVQNPATSSPGLAFLLATIGHYGEDGYLDYWRGLVENEVLVVGSWETAYNTEFSGSAGAGTRPIVVSYGSSPPFEVIYADQPLDEPPTGVVTGPGSCFRQIEFAGILVGTPNRELAELWIDFMLSTTFQEDLPLQMFVFPVNPHARLDETFQRFLAMPDEPAQVAPEDIAANRERWIQEWTEAVLR
jgi:thiamine transport system substrate-binding protein